MKTPKIYIIAGESSGDFLGAEILKKLKKMNCTISIIGGELMEMQCGASLFDISEISVGGITEIIPHIYRIKQLINKAIQDILSKDIDVLLTIDSPDFNFRIAKAVKKHNKKIRLIHLVAPTVWAWREKRAKKIASIYHQLLTLFDFEPAYFEKYGLKTTFVGHPFAQCFHKTSCKKEELILLLPGSRSQEIKTLLPIFLKAIQNRAEQIIIPTLPSQQNLVRSIIGERKILIVSSEEQKNELFRVAKFAIVASGTATLQLALSHCPMIVCYKLSNITYLILKKLVHLKHISLVNILLNRNAVPELIQNDCTPSNISACITSTCFAKQLSAFDELPKHITNQDV
ncbi:MAG: lipid-A-disaccharide synthase, partial [Holosporales bacterium]|nr:lipid-A-disaccharide synthase [Holosporales bacterium]